MNEDLKKIIYKLHPLERKVLPYIKLRDINEISKKSSLSEGEVSTAISMLQEKKYLIVEKLEQNYIGLDKFGKKYLKGDLPEIKFLKKILKQEKKQSQLGLEPEEFSAAIGILKKEQLINIKKEDEMVFSATPKAGIYIDATENPLYHFEEDVLDILLSKDQKTVYESLKQRKGFLKTTKKIKQEVILTDKGEELAKEIHENYQNLELIDALSTDMLKTNTWKGYEFRHYEVKIDTPIQDLGRRHPMIEANNIIRDVFVEMGFKEMQGPIVESEFWCFDALWIPQDHPARDEQDTFFLDGTSSIPQQYMDEVKLMHEEGIKKTHTSKGDFSTDVTKRRILRTHSTATTFRTLYDLGQKAKSGEDIDGKYFYVAHNFRDEAVDATHLAEFFQAEGFIIADNLSLADLMGFIKEYYAKLGIHKIRFKPTFNPYTEPSMEAHYYDPKMDKWYALINSGIFRPETLRPLGLENKRIIAWGMGASRVATLLAGKTSMRDITGATCDIEWLKTRPLMTRNIVRRD